MTRQPRLPLPARLLLHAAPVPADDRDGVRDDLIELFAARRSERGAVHAHWRLYHDIASLWSQPQPIVLVNASRSRLAFMRDAGADLRYASRVFARQPAILLLTILGLALGLGISTAAFSIMNAALRGEGLVDSDRVPGVLRTTTQSRATVWEYDEFLRLREGATRMQVEGLLTDAAPARIEPGDASPPSANVAFVSGGFFTATGGKMALGRPLEISDERFAGAVPIVVSHIFWTSQLNQDAAVIGRAIRIGRADATIVGVAERGFSVPNMRQIWAPLTAFRPVYDSAAVTRAPGMGIEVFGRLLPDVPLAEAEAQLSGVAAALPGGTPGDPVQVQLDPGAGLGRSASSSTLAVGIAVGAVIGLVLLLACANVATVLISTAITREREMGVRAALGASRGRIVRQLVTESLALGTIAALAGLMFAHWAIPVIGTMIEAPAGVDLAPDLNVYVFLAIATLIAGVGAGLAPARHSRAADLVTPLKGSDGAQQTRVAPRRLRSALVMTQAAASILLIVMAALFVRAAFRVAAIDVGFDATGLYSVSTGLGYGADPGDARVRGYLSRAVAELEAVPGVAAVALAEVPPYSGLTKTSRSGAGPAAFITHFNRTRANYFETIGLRILAGRTFTDAEVASKAPVAIVSESLARLHWPGRSPLGELVPDSIPIPSFTPAARPAIIGVAEDAVTAHVHNASTFAVYEPLDPSNEKFAHLLIRIAPGSGGVLEHASQRLRAIDPQANVRITSVETLLRQETSRPRMLAALTGGVGLVAIVLCVIGLYGLTASLVGQRTREMAIRVAIGAEPRDLLRLLMWDSLKPVVIGLAAGAVSALLVSRVVVATVFFGVSPQDPVAYAGATLALLASAMLAVLAPTRRAAAVDPVAALKGSG